MEIINKSEFNIEKKELLPQILNRIYAICKKDSSFKLKDKLQSSETTMEKLQYKIDKKKKLLEKSKILFQDLQKRNDNLKDMNEEIKTKLLESLGSEI